MVLAIHQTKPENVDSILKNGLRGEFYEESESPHYKKTGVFLFPTDSIDFLDINREYCSDKMYIIADIDEKSLVGDCNSEGNYNKYCSRMISLDDYTKNNKRNQYEAPEIFVDHDIKSKDILKACDIHQLFDLYNKCDSNRECILKEIKKNIIICKTK